MFAVFWKICIKLIINYFGSVAQIKSKAIQLQLLHTELNWKLLIDPWLALSKAFDLDSLSVPYTYIKPEIQNNRISAISTRPRMVLQQTIRTTVEMCVDIRLCDDVACLMFIVIAPHWPQLRLRQ